MSQLDLDPVARDASSASSGEGGGPSIGLDDVQSDSNLSACVDSINRFAVIETAAMYHREVREAAQNIGALSDYARNASIAVLAFMREHSFIASPDQQREMLREYLGTGEIRRDYKQMSTDGRMS